MELPPQFVELLTDYHEIDGGIFVLHGLQPRLVKLAQAVDQNIYLIKIGGRSIVDQRTERHAEIRGVAVVHRKEDRYDLPSHLLFVVV